jgi:hypothetical protein
VVVVVVAAAMMGGGTRCHLFFVLHEVCAFFV